MENFLKKKKNGEERHIHTFEKKKVKSQKAHLLSCRSSSVPSRVCSPTLYGILSISLLRSKMRTYLLFFFTSSVTSNF